jgi:outer membrane protein OmpA-like peptidoglycan-associated protein
LLKAVGYALASTPEIRKVLIGGHTDGVGGWEKNLALSQRRAESVRAWLIKNGVEEGRLEANGFGDSKPVQSNKTAKGRAANRRVQFVILDPASPGAK